MQGLSTVKVLWSTWCMLYWKKWQTIVSIWEFSLDTEAIFIFCRTKFQCMRFPVFHQPPTAVNNVHSLKYFWGWNLYIYLQVLHRTLTCKLCIPLRLLSIIIIHHYALNTLGQCKEASSFFAGVCLILFQCTNKYKCTNTLIFAFSHC